MTVIESWMREQAKIRAAQQKAAKASMIMRNGGGPK